MTTRDRASLIVAHIKRLNGELERLQADCEHETSVYKPDGSSGGWDQESSYWYECYCYDCRKRWTVDQNGKPPCTLKVDKVDVKANPAKIELMIGIEKCR